MRVYRKVRYVELHTQQARYDTYIYVLNFIYCATSREKMRTGTVVWVLLDGAGYSKLTLRS